MKTGVTFAYFSGESWRWKHDLLHVATWRKTGPKAFGWSSGNVGRCEGENWLHSDENQCSQGKWLYRRKKPRFVCGFRGKFVVVVTKNISGFYTAFFGHTFLSNGLQLVNFFLFFRYRWWERLRLDDSNRSSYWNSPPSSTSWKCRCGGCEKRPSCAATRTSR